MDAFCSLLVKDRVVPRAKIEEAQQRQGMFGGRIGTILLEMGVVSHEQLIDYLARASDFAPISTELYRNIDPDALTLMDLDAIIRTNILPLRIEPELDSCRVLVTQATEAGDLNDMAEALGLSLIAHIAPEFHFVKALGELHDRDLPQRYLQVVRKHPLVFSVGSASGGKRRRDSGEDEGPAREHLLGFGWAADEIEAFLRDCYSRDATLELLLGYSGNFAQRRVLLVITRKGLLGYTSAGFVGKTLEPRSVRVAIEPGGLIATVCQGDNFYQGPPENADLHLIYQALDVSVPYQCVLLPIPVGPRAGLLLMLDDDRLKVNVETLTSLFVAVRQVTKCLERIIRLTKRNELPPPELRVPDVPRHYRREEATTEPRGDTVKTAGPRRTMPTAAAKIVAEQRGDAEDTLDGLPGASDSIDESPQTDADSLPGAAIMKPQLGRSSTNIAARTSPSDPAPGDGLMQVQKTDSQRMRAARSDVDVLASFGDDLVDDEFHDGWDIPSGFELARSSDGGGETSTAMDAKPLSRSEKQKVMRDTVEFTPPDVRDTVEMTLAEVKDELHGSAPPEELQRASPAPSGSIYHADTGSELARVAEMMKRLTTSDFQFLNQADQSTVMRARQRAGKLYDALKQGEIEVAATRARDLATMLETAGFALGKQMVAEAADALDNLASRTHLTDAAPAEQTTAPPQSPTTDPGKPGVVSSDPELRAVDSQEDEAEDQTGESGGLVDAHTQPTDDESEAESDGGTSIPDGADSAAEAEPSIPLAPGGDDIIDGDSIEMELLVRDEPEPVEEKPEDSTPPPAPDEPPASRQAIERYAPTVDKLCKGNRQERVEAARELLESRGMAIPALLEEFPGPLRIDRYDHPAHNQPPVEDHGPLLRVLVEFGNLSAPALLGFLSDVSNEVRFYATWIFSRVRYEPALEALHERLFDKDQMVRDVAQVVVKSYRNTEAFDTELQRLRDALASDDAFRVGHAASTLSALADLQAVPYLIRRLSSDNARIADCARKTLTALCFQDYGLDQRAWDQWWEANADGDRHRWLYNALDHTSEHVRLAAAEELRSIPGLLVNYNPSGPVPQRKRAQQLVAQFFNLET